MDKSLSDNTQPKRDQGLLGAQTRRYALAGIIFGLAFPVIATVIKIAQLQLPLNPSTIIEVQRAEQLLWIIDTAPLFLGLSAGLAGRRQDILLETNQRLLQRGEELTAIKVNLEQRVMEHTQELDERNSQMRASVFFTQEIAGIQDMSALLARAVALIPQHFGHQASIFLLDDQGKTAFLHASSSEAGRKLVEHGYRVGVDSQSLVGRVAEHGKLQIASASDTTGLKRLEMPIAHSEIALPLIARGKTIGVLDVRSERQKAFGQNETEVLQLLADQLAVAIDSLRLLSRSEALVNQLEILTSQQTRAAWQAYLKSQKLAYQFTSAGIKPLDSSAGQRDEAGLKIPVVLRGQEIGSIRLQRKDEPKWADAERDLAQKVATQVALALDNSRLLEETRQRAVHEQTVNEISARFSRSLDVDTLLQTAVRELGALSEVAEVSVYIKPSDEDGRKK